MPQTRTILYALLKPWVKLGARFFFSKLVIRNADRLPLDKPVLLVANHQNAMLDPVLICLFSRKQLHWLTRADIFKKPTVNNLLRSLNMLPVFRERDRVADIVERNKTTFDECFGRMKANAVVCIFPEGTHRGKKQLVPLKKGMARMVTGAMEAGVDNMVIVPVGLDYENYYEYRKKLLITFGEPIEANSFFSNQNTAANKIHAEITEEIRKRISALMIDIRDDENYHEIMALHPLSDKLSSENNPGKNFEAFKLLSEKLDGNETARQFLHHDVKEYRQLMHELHIQEDLYRESLSPLHWLGLIAGAPFALIAAFFFYPLYALTESFVARVVKDPLFRNSIRLCFWTFLVPVILLLVSAVLALISFNGKEILFAISVIVFSGIIALNWWPLLKRTKHAMRCNAYHRSENPHFKKWLQKREAVIDFMKNLNK